MSYFNKNICKKNRALTSILFALLFALYCPSVLSSGNLPLSQDCSTGIINSEAGPICGKTETTESGKKSRVFLGIPYAESTEKNKRWQPPIPRATWSEVYKALELGSICPQGGDPLFDVPQSEDCLSLNIWTPGDEGSQTKKYAVMVFIHGGSFNSGAGSYPLYDGSYLAANKEVIVVSFNYRLGVLGFLATDEVSGNFGFMDQQLALEWVKKNVSNFGGDPERVTIFGESAGAISVGLHLLSAPLSFPLFRAGLMQSNLFALPLPTLKQAKVIGDTFTSSLKCASIECLRAYDIEDVLSAQKEFASSLPEIFLSDQFMIPFGPVIDGLVLTQQPLSVAISSKITKPILLGSNKNEGILFESQNVSTSQYISNIERLFGSSLEKILKQYPPHSKVLNQISLANIFNDAFFRCPARKVAISQNGLTYLYSYDFPAPIQLWGPSSCMRDGNVCHGAELPFVFHTANKLNYQFTPLENQVSNVIMEYWTNFVKYLNPEGSAKSSSTLIDWQAFEVPKNKYMVINATSSIKSDPYAEVCEFWDTIGYDFTSP